MNRKEFRQKHTINLQGKEYLEVAYRVLEFRKDKPNWAIVTRHLEIGDDFYVYAQVETEGGEIRATAHKRVRKNMRGPAAQWPLETAETGAIGRALALCGYGTLAGDLDEHDELADAPAGKTSVDSLMVAVTNATTYKEVEELGNQLRGPLKKLKPTDPKRVAAIDLVARRKKELQGK